MKNALDKSIEDGVDDLVICGLQVDGFLGRAYVMDLCFDGLYRMILIGEFKLPEDSTSWGTVFGCYQILSTIRDIVNREAARYQTITRNTRSNTNQKATKTKMTKAMFLSPIKLPKA